MEGLDPRTDISKVWKTIASLDGRRSKNQPGIELKTEGENPKTATTGPEKLSYSSRLMYKQVDLTNCPRERRRKTRRNL